MSPPAQTSTFAVSAPAPAAEPLAPWLIVLAGLSFLYVPSFIDLFKGADAVGTIPPRDRRTVLYPC